MISNLFRRGFVSLSITQFFGAANDNILKGVIVFVVIKGVWEGQLGDGGQGIVNVCFTVPFILLSGLAGQFSDRKSKRDVSVLMKILEIPIAIIALIGFWVSNLWITLSALIALACQSAFFGPAKYGMIPELVESRDLSRANGTINMMTNIAVIVGTVAAGEIVDFYNPIGGEEGDRLLWLPGVVMVLTALVGLAVILCLPPLAHGNSSLTYFRNPFAPYLRVLRKTAGSAWQMVMFAWGYFYFVAGIALMIIPEYTIVFEPYDATYGEVGILLAVMGVSIGAGCAVAGLISGHAIQPKLVPIGAAGLTLFCILLGVVPATLPFPEMPERWRMLASPTAGLLFGTGFSAGFYIVPLQALLQRLAPEGELGRFLGVASGIAFAFVALSGLMYRTIRPGFGVDGEEQHPERIFLLCAALMVAGSVFFLWRLKVRGFSFASLE